MFAVYVVIYTLFLLIRYDSFQSDYFDLGLWSRALYSASTDPARIPALVLPTKESMIGHTDPFLLFFVPFSRIWPDPRWLLLTTTVSLGGSIFPLYFLARRYLASQRLAWLFCGIYLLNPLFNNVNRYDFQPIAFVPVLIFTALCFYESNNPLGFLTCIILANSVQEFVALLTAFLSVSLLTVHWIGSRRKRLQRADLQRLSAPVLVAAGLLGIAWFSFADIIQSYFDPSTPLASFLSVASSGPDPHAKALYLFLMVAPLLFVPLLEPILLAPVLPYVGVVVLGSHLAYWTIYYQYGAFTVPFIFYAALVASQRISFRLPTVFRLSSLRILLALLIVANVAFSINYSALSPLSAPAYTWSYVSNHDQVLASMIDLIPTNATVLTQGQFYPHLLNRADISLYTGPFDLYNRMSNVAPQYLMYDATLSSFYYPPTIYGVPKNSSIPPFQLLPEMVSAGEYGLYSAYDGAYLFEKNYQGPFISPRGVVSRPLVGGETWYDNVTYALTPFGMNITGGQYVGVVRDTSFAINESSFSISFRLSESGMNLSKDWAGLILGWKDPLDYSLINFNYLGGSMNLTSFNHGTEKTQAIGSTSPLSSVGQYFYVVAHSGSLKMYLNSQLVGTVPVDASVLLGGIGFENWQEETSVQFLQFTALQ